MDPDEFRIKYEKRTREKSFNSSEHSNRPWHKEVSQIDYVNDVILISNMAVISIVLMWTNIVR